MTDQASTEIATADAKQEHSFIRDAGEDKLWTSGTFPADLFQKGYVAGGTAKSLMRLSIALACMDVISQDFGKVPLQLRKYLKNRRGSVIVEPQDHPIARMLDRRPSRYFGWSEFNRIMALFLACSSEYFVPVLRARDGQIKEIQGVDAGKVTPLVDETSRRYVYDIRPTSPHERAQFGWAEGRRTDADVAHIRTRSLNGIDMIGNQQIAAASFELLSKMASYQKGIFSNGGMGPMAFLFPDEMTDVQYKRLKDDISYSRQRAVEEGKPFLLEGNGKEGGMPKVVPLSGSSVDNEFIKANAAAALDVCRTFRCPPHKVYLLDSVKYDNQDTQERQYVEGSLVPMFRSVAECLEVVLLTDAEREDYCLAHDMDVAAGMDPAARQKIYESRWKSGMVTFDEMREGIGMNAAGGDAGKARMFSGNFILVDENNEVIMSAGGNTPGAEGDQAPQDDAVAPAKDLGPNVVAIR